MVWQCMFYFGVGGSASTLIIIPLMENVSIFNWIYGAICFVSLIAGLANKKRW